MVYRRARLAAQNNASWCDLVCRAHGVPGEFSDAVWRNRHPSPPFYPNLITLVDMPNPSNALEHIRQLCEIPLPGAWGVKDSFACLDLSIHGFDLLFEAEWIWREPMPPPQQNLSDGMKWSQAKSPTYLADWEAAWCVANGQEASSNRPCQFPLSLLNDPSIVFFAAHKGSELVAGGILNSSDNVAGVSNVFILDEDKLATWTGLMQNAGHVFPGAPLVGYESGDSLNIACACGFEPVGNLRVWLHHNRG